MSWIVENYLIIIACGMIMFTLLSLGVASPDSDSEELVYEHIGHPHQPGRQRDCWACEARCFCTPTGTQCVHCVNAMMDRG